jgi:hypothetical protein
MFNIDFSGGVLCLLLKELLLHLTCRFLKNNFSSAVVSPSFFTAEPATKQICCDFKKSYEGEKNMPNVLFRLTTTKRTTRYYC